MKAKFEATSKIKELTEVLTWIVIILIRSWYFDRSILAITDTDIHSTLLKLKHVWFVVLSKPTQDLGAINNLSTIS